MEFRYKKLMEEHDLILNELPEDAQTGVEELNKVLRAVSMLERKGKSVTSATVKKIAAMDKWVTYEILDYLQDTDNNDDDMPVDADDVLDDLDKQNTKGLNNRSSDKKDDVAQPDKIGLRIEEELDRLMESGKTSYTIDELRNRARNTYKELWESYEEHEKNGIVTTKYSLIEDNNKNFNLKLN